ncbi:MAG: virulence-associated E family protein [Ruminococcus sp.]|nr:virulence-associated E family protein [Ruminococcus sp.]
MQRAISVLISKKTKCKKGGLIINNDKKITIATVRSRFDVKCQISEMFVSELYQRLSVTQRGTETRSQYLKADKKTRDNLKDVGGFIGGSLKNGIRKAGYVEKRDLVCLDMDCIAAGQTEAVVNKILSLGVSVGIYSTRKHCPEAPRLRAVFPLSNSVTADEYEPVARQIAFFIDSEMRIFDRTTFDVCRIMYWPSTCSDGEYIFRYTDAPFADSAGLLALYGDGLRWRDFTQWPRCPAEDISHAPASKQEDPLAKKGIVGAFCRVYSISEAISAFLPEVYTSAGADRYTYAGGSTTGGAIVYDNKFLYSHHATDPASGILCNAFDLIRIHMFGSEDDSAKAGTPAPKMPSFMKMTEFALTDPKVDMQLRTEKAAQVYEEFADAAEGTSAEAAAEHIKALTSWTSMLKVDANGVYVKSSENALIALENDPLLKGRIYYNEFIGMPMGLAPLPFGKHLDAKENTPFFWEDADDAGLYIYLEKLIGLKNQKNLTIALQECRSLHRFHPVKEYLSHLAWDGVPRIETLFQDYLGARDTAYVRTVAKMTLTAAVTRIYAPGTKFDTAVVFVGNQGIGKSSFIAGLAKYSEWYTDSLTVLDKSAVENIQGVWLAELAELSALKRSDLETTKAFISRTQDKARLAYGHYATIMPRTCILWGTTNTYNFLKDSTGERRFLPIDVGEIPKRKSVFTDLPAEVDQIWAEALFYYREGKTRLTLPRDIERMAQEEQDAHFDRSANQGIIEQFLERQIPPDWDNYSTDERRLFLQDAVSERTDLVPRQKVCTMEIWCEALGGRQENYQRNKGLEINDIMSRIPDWHATKSPRRHGPYGNQRGFERDGS